jgi:nitroreductase
MTGPDRATLEAALHSASRAPSLRNLQPWRWHVDRDGVRLFADWDRRTGDGAAERRDVLLGCGAVLDHCALALAAAGWTPRVHRFSDPGRRGPLAIIEVIGQMPDGAQAELFGAIAARRADRRPFRSPQLPRGTLELLHVRAARLGVELSVVPRLRWARRPGSTVELRYGDGADLQAQSDGAVMVVIATGRDDDLARLQAGEALSRVLLTATASGLATCPLTEPLNDARSRLALACEVFDGEAHPQALVRLGVPASDADPPPPPEPRRSVSETTVWDLADR